MILVIPSYTYNYHYNNNYIYLSMSLGHIKYSNILRESFHLVSLRCDYRFNYYLLFFINFELKCIFFVNVIDAYFLCQRNILSSGIIFARIQNARLLSRQRILLKVK